MTKLIVVLTLLIASAYAAYSQVVATYQDNWRGAISDSSILYKSNGEVIYLASYSPKYKPNGRLDEDGRGHMVPYFVRVASPADNADAMFAYLPDYDQRHVYESVRLPISNGTWVLAGTIDSTEGRNYVSATYTYGDLVYNCILDMDIPQPIGPFILRGSPGLVLEAKCQDTQHSIILLSYRDAENHVPLDDVMSQAEIREHVDLKTYRLNARQSLANKIERSISFAREIDIEGFSISGTFSDPLLPTYDFREGY